MNRRRFLELSVAGLAGTAGLSRVAAGGPGERRPARRGTTKIAAYYLAAHLYTCVPRHIREDMEWMADKGTDYVCLGILEQDLFAAHENHALIIAEAARAGMQVVAVPSRWAGLTAGAPKVPSLFSVLNPQTWIVNDQGSTRLATRTSGVISSVHAPETFEFFCATLEELYRQHPALAGLILDEPKAFVVDHSPRALAALGANAPRAAHLAAAGDFYSRVCGFAKARWPDKFTALFQQAHVPADERAASAAVANLDYYGVDGRPWGEEDDRKLVTGDPTQESGKGKILLGGRGEAFLRAARQEPGRKSFILAENHNLTAAMIEPLERNYPAVLALQPDLFTYYYYPRNVAEPDRIMAAIGQCLKEFAGQLP